MPKKDKKDVTSPEEKEEVIQAPAQTDSRPYVEILREKFMKNHDPTIMLRPEERLSLEWRQITYKVPIVKKTCCKVKEKTEKAILRNVSGYLPAGSLLVRPIETTFGPKAPLWALKNGLLLKTTIHPLPFSLLSPLCRFFAMHFLGLKGTLTPPIVVVNRLKMMSSFVPAGNSWSKWSWKDDILECDVAQIEIVEDHGRDHVEGFPRVETSVPVLVRLCSTR